jgi:hypothetical protein
MGNPKCFTCKIKAQYRRTRRVLLPVLSRIQNIGYELGENNRTTGVCCMPSHRYL